MTTRSLILHPHEVRAALDGRLRLIVRPVKPQPEYQDATGRWTFCVSSTDKNSRDKWSYCVIDDNGHHYTERGRERCVLSLRDPFGVPGDRLIGKEAYYIQNTHGQHRTDGLRWGSWSGLPMTISPDGKRIVYYKEGFDRCAPMWRSPATMPAWASRITLEVIGVRCVRTKDLTEDDVRACGSFLGRCSCSEMNRKPRTAIESKFRQTWCHIHGEEFRSFWNAKYAKRGLGWEINPWAWAVEVRRVEG